MPRDHEYWLRSAKLKAQLIEIDDPLGRVMLRALIDALDEAASEDARRAGQKLSMRLAN